MGCTRTVIEPSDNLFAPGEPAAKEKPTKPRQPNPLFDAIVAACGWTGQLHSENAKLIGKTLKLITEASPHVTAAEIAVRAANYRRKMPGMQLTPTAFSKHWPSLATASNEVIRTAF